MNDNPFIKKIFTSDNNIEYIPDELYCLRYSLRYTKLLPNLKEDEG